MAKQLVIIPQRWAERYRPLPLGWLNEHAPGLLRRCPGIASCIERTAYDVGVDPRLLVTRMELEQSAISYRWDGTTTDYNGDEAKKLSYLCGVDRTDAGDRPGGWFGPEKQILGCALRFKYWYRGRDGPNVGWENWLGLKEDPRYAPGVPVTRKGVTIVPANQASADCLRYTTSMTAQERLRAIGRTWFPYDYDEEEQTQTMGSEREVSLQGFHDHLAQLTISRPVNEVVVHHTWRPTVDDYKGAETVRAVTRYHVEQRGWSDNGYHVMVGPDGRIFLCRSLGRAGAHVEGRNHDTVGVCLIGDYDVTEPESVTGYRTLMKVVAELLVRFNLGAEAIRFHREFAPKTCPGLKMALGPFRKEVMAVMDVSVWARDSVERVKRLGLMTGYSDGTFGGTKPTTREELAVVLCRLLDLLASSPKEEE